MTRAETMPSTYTARRWRRHARVTPLLALCTLCACWAATKSLPAPDVTARIGRASSARVRLDQINTIMQRDVSRIESLHEEFFAWPTANLPDDYPVATFRLVAMACINWPYARDNIIELPQDESPDEQLLPEELIARRFGITCAPTALVTLHKQLDASGLAWTQAQLARVEELRQLRQLVNERAGKIPKLTARARKQLVEQRASLRQLDARSEQRRLDYSDEVWKTTRARIDAYERELDALDASISEARELAPSWQPRQRAAIEAFTYELAWFGLEQ